MKIKNSIKTLPNYALPRMLYWVCEELSLPFAGVHSVEFNSTPKTWGGRVIFKERRIVTSINPSARFPLKLKNRATEKDEPVQNAVELLVFATAQNLSYLREYWEVSFVRPVSQPHVPQSNVDKRAFDVLKKFREGQADFLARWNTPPPPEAQVEEHTSEGDLKTKLGANKKALDLLRDKLETMKKDANKVREEIHRLHVRNGYLSRIIAKGKPNAAEWTVPERLLLADVTTPLPPGTEDQHQDGQTVVVD